MLLCGSHRPQFNGSLGVWTKTLLFKADGRLLHFAGEMQLAWTGERWSRDWYVQLYTEKLLPPDNYYHDLP